MAVKQVKCLEIQFFTITINIPIYFKIAPHSLAGNLGRSPYPLPGEGWPASKVLACPPVVRNGRRACEMGEVRVLEENRVIWRGLRHR
jgi:hypothetical protein